MKRRVLIVDDHSLLRHGIAKLLPEETYEVEEAASGTEALVRARHHRPDLVIMDLSMPGPNGIETAKRLLEIDASLKIILFTQQLGRELTRAAFRAGVRAYVAKQSAVSELLKAVEIVEAGDYYLTPISDLLGMIGEAGTAMRQNPADQIQSPLTPRQIDVLKLIAAGKSAKEIGSELDISAKTVEFHRNSIADELGVRSTAELTRYAFTSGLIETD